MDPSMPMILPKGFVVNSNEIYQEVAKYPILPPEKTREYWLVYNTTHRELKDPTARRLENFWWRVWGSDRRFLSGKTLASRFEDISTKPPFVHIPGPPNRWEPPPEVITLLQALQRHQEETERLAMTKGGLKGKGKSAEGSIKALASSASKPPPAHPILKKSRGDSKSGPRPTARFADVPESSNDEDDKTREESSSGSASAKGLQMRPSASITPPAKQDKKKSPTPTKKFLANTPSRRRPGLARRVSSQTSGGSAEFTAKELAGSGGTKQGQLPRNGAKNGTGLSAGGGPSPLQASQSLAAASDSQKQSSSSKSPGKKAAVRSPTATKYSQQEFDRPSVRRDKSETGAAASSGDDNIKKGKGKGKDKEPMPPRPAKATAEDNTKAPGSPKLQRVQSTDLTQAKTAAVPPSALTRSYSHIDPRRPLREASFGRSVSVGLTSKAATTMTTTDSAAGTIIGVDQPYPNVPLRPEEDDFELVREPSSSSLLDSRFTPTQPSTAPTLPLGRTKSQLTLLLEKEKERKGGK